MNRKIMSLLWVTFLSAWCLVWGNARAGAAAEAGVMDAKNEVCPVSGDAVNPKISYVHQGKRYGFCCKMCIRDFKKNPEKFLGKIEGAAPLTASAHAGHGHGGHDHASHEHGGKTL